MKKCESVDKGARHETIRQRAFVLADSGTLDDWKAVGRALGTCFDVVDIERVLASRFFRLILDQRCRARREMGIDDQTNAGLTNQEDTSDPAESAVVELAPAHSRPLARQVQADEANTAIHGTVQPRLSGDIAALLADGRELTAAQVAQQLGAAVREVQGALQSMLACDEVHVARRTPRGAGGRSTRIFAMGGNTVAGATSDWPRADPVVLRAMDALVRHGGR